MTAPLRAGDRDLPGRLAWLAFLVFIVTSPLRLTLRLVDVSIPPVSSDLTSPSIAATEILLIVVLVLWVMSLLARPRGVRPGPAFLAVPVVAFLAIAWLGVAGSIDPRLSAVSALRLTLLVALGVYLVNEVDRVDRLMVPIALMIAVQAVVGIGQVAVGHSLGLGFLGEQDLDPAVSGTSIVASLDGTRLLRAYGLTDHPNILGGVVAFALLIFGSVRGRTRGERVWRGVVFATGVVVLFLTFSRAAWIAFAVGLLIALALFAWIRDRPEVRRWAGAAALAVLVCLPLVVPFGAYLAARSTAAGPIRTETRSIDERLALAQGALAAFAERPVLGSGLGTLPIALLAAEPVFGFDYQPAHVVLIDAAAETGLLGALSYLAIVVAPWVALVRIRGRWTTALVAASAALAAVTIVGLFDYYTWTATAGRTWAWIALALWAVAYHDAIRGGGDA